LLHAERRRFLREREVVLDTGEALLLRRRYDLSISQKTCSAIVIKR
jgi:hypothetical protein